MSKDIVYREDAIDAIECITWYHQNRHKDMVSGANSAEDQAWYKAEDIYDALKAVPSADTDLSGYSDRLWKNAYERGKADGTAWIPCSERLPSEQGQYLVTFPLCNEEPWVYLLSFNKGKFYETDDEWGDVEYDDVTAWMPLPKPWKGADDE